MAALGAIIILAVLAAFLFLKSGNKNPIPPQVADLFTETTPSEKRIPEKVEVLRDKVALTRDNKKTDLVMGESTEILPEDKITTDTNGLAILNYQEGTIVRLSGGSEVIFKDGTTLSQTLGTIYVRFKKILGVEDSFSVETPTMVASVRGTAFALSVAKNQEDKLVVTDHEVEVVGLDQVTKKPLENSRKTVKKDEQAQYSKARKAFTVGVQKLSTNEKQWIDFNQESDNEPDKSKIKDIVKKFIKATPAPTPTATRSGTPAPTKAPASYINSMPGTGYTTSTVKTEVGDFALSCIGANKSSTRVITDSANDNDCKNDCPVLPLDQYAARNGGTAAMNGMYFCPADYPACSDKKNSFDTLLFNSRAKKYINSDNNVYSNIPFLVVNSDSSPRFIGRSSEWGRDTGIQAGIAGNPMLIQGGNIAVVEGNLEDRQKSIKANRGAFVEKGGLIYLCIVRSANVPDSAKVYKALGVDNAINIDGGGSSAMWVGGSYKYGPGRQIPNAIIFAPK